MLIRPVSIKSLNTCMESWTKEVLKAEEESSEEENGYGQAEELL